MCMSWQLKSTDIHWHPLTTCSYKRRLFERSAPQRFNVDDPAAIVHLKEEGFAALLHHGNFVAQSHLGAGRFQDVGAYIDRSARYSYWIGCFYCILLLHFETWLSEFIVLCLRPAALVVFRQSSGVFSTSWRCRWQPTFWKYMELSTQNAVRREDPLTWLCQFFESFRWPQFGTGYSSLFHAFQIFSETSHVSIIFEYIWYICLEPLWICHKSKGMVQAVETVLHCFNMFQHVPLLAKVAEAQLAWSGWQWDHQLWWNRPIRASAFPRKSRNFLSKKKDIFCTLAGLKGKHHPFKRGLENLPNLAHILQVKPAWKGLLKGAKPVSPSLSFNFIRICSGIHVVHSTAAAGHASLCQLVGRFKGRFARELRWMLRFPATCCGCKAWGEEIQGYPGDVRQDLLLK